MTVLSAAAAMTELVGTNDFIKDLGFYTELNGKKTYELEMELETLEQVEEIEAVVKLSSKYKQGCVWITHSCNTLNEKKTINFLKNGN